MPFFGKINLENGDTRRHPNTILSELLEKKWVFSQTLYIFITFAVLKYIDMWKEKFGNYLIDISK